MPKEASKAIQEKIQEFIKNQITKAFAKGLKRYINEILKIIIKSIAGAILASVGLIFLFIGIVNFLDKFIERWLSWIITGLIVILIGSIIILSAIRKNK